jgi:hypothetical protein
MSRKYSKDSFERYGDDFCELILSYLSITQKFEFECVSKQWQRLIFNKQFSLLVKISGEYCALDFDAIDRLWHKKNRPFYKLNSVWFETVLKKCKFIKHLQIKRISGALINLDDGNIFDIISDNCLYLKEFIVETGFACISDETLIKFMDKCCKKLKVISSDCFDNQQMKDILIKCPEIIFVCFGDISVFIESVNENFLSKLTGVEIKEFTFNELKIFVEKFKINLKDITIDFGSEKVKRCIEFNESLLLLSKFVNLEKLKILEICFESLIINVEYLQIIANKCKKLENLTLNIRCIKFPKNIDVFKVFANFAGLKKLDLAVSKGYSSSSLEYLSGLEKLTHLYIAGMKLNENNLEFTNQYLPRLKFIQLNNIREFNENSLKYISKLPFLKKVIILGMNKRIIENSICYFIMNSPQLSEFYSLCNINITDSIIDACIVCAKKKPKIFHKFHFWDNNKYTPVFKLSMYNSPVNLSIEFKEDEEAFVYYYESQIITFYD